MALRPEGVLDDAILRVLRVPPECEGMRLDRFLPTQLRATSRTRAQQIIDVSAYTEEGRRMRSSDRLRAEQKIYLWRPALDEEAPPYPIATLYEDSELLVVNKPPLMTVHPTARHHKQTVIKTLVAERPGQYLSLIHRLDRDTSGVLLVAKSVEADRSFKMQLEERSNAAIREVTRSQNAGRADKTYLAITKGVPPQGIVDLPLEEDPSPLRVKVRVTSQGRGMVSRTGFEVLGTTGIYALVRCHLFTGRQHQIRVHLEHLGAPVVGDKLYGPDEGLLARAADGELSQEDVELLELPHHALHAATHRLYHPFQRRNLAFSAAMPDSLSEFWRSRGGDPSLLHVGSAMEVLESEGG